MECCRDRDRVWVRVPAKGKGRLASTYPRARKEAEALPLLWLGSTVLQ